MSLMTKINALLVSLGTSIKKGKYYRGIGSKFRAAKLRLATTNAGKRWKSKPCSINVRGLPAPVTVRSSTSDFAVVGDIFEAGEYAFVKKWDIPANAFILDFGGNIGLASLYFTTLYPESRFICLEPDQANMKLIETNCRWLIDAGRFHTLQGFIAASDGNAGIDRTEDAWGIKKVAPADDQAERIACYSVNTVFAMFGVNNVDLLKCDIEGSEAELFKNCSGWMSKVRHLIVETHEPYMLADLYKDLRDSGWQFEVDREDLGKICFLRRVG
jgi:FkbM family methyltransferase